MSRLFRTSLMLAFFFGLEKVLGFARQVITARQFHLSAELDAFNAANNLPDLLFALISAGALGMAFIPVLSEVLEKEGRPELWRLFSRVTNFILPITAILSVLIAIFAPQLVHWQIGIAPGFNAVQQQLVVEMMRLNLLATFIFSMAGLITAGLQANQHFFLPALAPAMYDFGMLFGVLVLSPKVGYSLGPITLPAYGMGVFGLVYGAIIGSLLFLLIQVPGLVIKHFHWTPEIQLKNPRVQRVIHLMGPRVLTVLCIQLIFIIQDNLASRLATGAVSALVLGWSMLQVPETLIGTSQGVVLLPTLSELIVRGDLDQVKAILNRSMRSILALSIPLFVLISLLLPSVVTIFGLNAEDANLVVWTGRAFLLGLMGQSLLEIAVRTFYAQQNALVPLAAAGFMVLVMIILSIPLSIAFGAPGIGLANSMAFTAQAVLLIFLLQKRIGKFLALGRTPYRVIGGALAGGLVCYGTLVILGGMSFFANGLFAGLILAAFAGLAGAAVVIPFILPELKLLTHL